MLQQTLSSCCKNTLYYSWEEKQLIIKKWIFWPRFNLRRNKEPIGSGLCDKTWITFNFKISIKKKESGNNDLNNLGPRENILALLMLKSVDNFEQSPIRSSKWSI